MSRQTAEVIELRARRQAPVAATEPAQRQRRTFGKIRELPSGRFQASYVVDGERFLAPVTFLTKGDAGAWLDLRHAELLEHRWKPPAPPEPDTITLRAYAEKWVQQRRNRHGEPLRPRTAALYRGILNGHIYPTFGDTPLADITANDVDDWHATLLPDAPTRRAHTYTLLSSIMKSASTGRRRIITENPCQIPHASKADRRFEPVPATPAQVSAIAENMPERLRLLVLLGAWVGLRYGELAELRRKDVDVATMTVHVRRAVTWLKGETVIGPPKSRAGVRAVAVPASLRSVIEDHLARFAQAGDDGLVFPAASGKHLHPSTAMKPFRKARAAAGRPDLRLHDLRHTAATTAAQTGATLRELMARMGHSTQTAALVYQHVAAERDRAIADGMDALIAPKTTTSPRRKGQA